MAGCVTDLSREVGGLSHADAGPPKPVPLVATTAQMGALVTFFSEANDGFFLL